MGVKAECLEEVAVPKEARALGAQRRGTLSRKGMPSRVLQHEWEDPGREEEGVVRVREQER